VKIAVWKEEDEIDGEAVGPFCVMRASDYGRPRPFLSPCGCETPRGDSGAVCEACGGRIPPPYVSLREARARAAELGIDLKES